MKTILNIRLLLLFAVAIITGVVACEKDDEDVPGSSGKTELLSFGPTGSKPGDTLKFVGYNLDKVTEIQFTGTGAVVPASAFISLSKEQLFLVLPASTEPGYVTLKSPTGDVVSKTIFNMNAPVAITSVTAEARPGTNITIKGNLLNWVTSVTFEKDLIVTAFVSQKIDEIVVTVPATAQTGNLVLAYGGTDPGTVETTTPLIVTLPKITGMTPNPVLHAADLTITGTNLDLVKSISFTGVASPITSFVSQAADKIVVKVPGSTTKGKVTVTAASTVSTQSASDLDVILPAVTGMTPNPVDPEANLTITGTNLNLVSSVLFQNAPAVSSFVSQSATQIVVKVPKGVTEGKIILNVLNSTLTVQSPNILQITGAAPPPTIAFPFYKDAISSNWNGWVGDGWGGTKNYSNGTPVREGDKSIKIDYVGGWGSPFQLGGANVAIGSYTTFKISLYGAPGSAGKTVNLQLNGAGGQSITLVEGKWTDYAFPISSLISGSTITQIILQETTGAGGFTVYIDAVGLN